MPHWGRVDPAGRVCLMSHMSSSALKSHTLSVQALKDLGYADALKAYLQEDRPFLGICLGLQLLFDGSDENGGVECLGLIPGQISRFTPAPGLPVPHIGWNQPQPR